jgi:hypothetical protein
MSLTVKGQTDAYLLMSTVPLVLNSLAGIAVGSHSKRKHTGELTCCYKPGISWEAWSALDNALRKTGHNYNFSETRLQFFQGFLFDGKSLPKKESRGALAKHQRYAQAAGKGLARVGENSPDFRAIFPGAPGGRHRQVELFAYLQAAEFRNRDRSAVGFSNRPGL